MPGTHGPREPSPGPKNPRTQPNGPRAQGMGPANPEPRDPPSGVARAPCQGGLPHPPPSKTGGARAARSQGVGPARALKWRVPVQLAERADARASLRVIREHMNRGARSQGVGPARALKWRVPVQLSDRADARAKVFLYYVPSGNNEPRESTDCERFPSVGLRPLAGTLWPP